MEAAGLDAGQYFEQANRLSMTFPMIETGEATWDDFRAVGGQELVDTIQKRWFFLDDTDICRI